MTPRPLLSTVLFAAALLLSAGASAATIQLAGTLDGALANAGAGTGSTGTGSVSVTLDDVTGDLSWSFDFSGLLGDFTVAHFHGPALPNQNAGVQIGTPVTLDPGNRSGMGVGNATLSASQIADLTGGLWYLNVHSQFAPGGELRANLAVVPEPAGLFLAALAGLALTLRRR